jgi:hypothetical protein
VIVLWDGHGIANDGQPCDNSYAWVIKMRDGKVIHGTALYASRLVGDLATGSPAFATRWARHNVRFHTTSTKRLHIPLVGEIELTGDALDLAGDGLTLVAYTAEAESRAQEQLDLLLSWALNHRETEAHENIPY